MSELSKLPNIGAVMVEQLQQAGIHTPEELKRIGSKEAWLRIQSFDASACYNRLCGLEGAIRNIRWHSLPDEIKRDLKAFYQEHKH